MTADRHWSQVPQAQLTCTRGSRVDLAQSSFRDCPISRSHQDPAHPGPWPCLGSADVFQFSDWTWTRSLGHPQHWHPQMEFMVAHSDSKQGEEEQAISSQQGPLLQRHGSWCRMGRGGVTHYAKPQHRSRSKQAAKSKGHGP